jgi:hypothetical protein
MVVARKTEPKSVLAMPRFMNIMNPKPLDWRLGCFCSTMVVECGLETDDSPQGPSAELAAAVTLLTKKTEQLEILQQLR